MPEVSTFRLYLLRATYLFMVLGLGVYIWPGILDHPVDLEHYRGVVRSILGGVSLLALLGIRYPLKMLPLMFFELVWKSIWLLSFGLPLWSAGQLDAETRETMKACLTQRILDRYFPDRRPVETPTPRPDRAVQLRRFAGTYRANVFCHSCRDGGPAVQDFDVRANKDGTIEVWDQPWAPVDSLYFATLDGRRHIGFAEDAGGRITALTAGSWRVLERIR